MLLTYSQLEAQLASLILLDSPFGFALSVFLVSRLWFGLCYLYFLPDIYFPSGSVSDNRKRNTIPSSIRLSSISVLLSCVVCLSLPPKSINIRELGRFPVV